MSWLTYHLLTLPSVARSLLACHSVKQALGQLDLWLCSTPVTDRETLAWLNSLEILDPDAEYDGGDEWEEEDEDLESSDSPEDDSVFCKA